MSFSSKSMPMFLQEWFLDIYFVTLNGLHFPVSLYTLWSFV